jgi:putative oxidoreductase
MKIASNIASGLLGLIFVPFSLVVLLKLGPMPPRPDGASATLFMDVFATSGYLTFVKVLELVGGCLVAVPCTRNFGLLVLGPIILNILAFHIFIMKGEGLIGPPILVSFLALFLLWSSRRAFAGLMN